MTDKIGYEQFWENLDSFNDFPLQGVEEFLRLENRSSTIFPVFKSSSITTYVEFLSYWLKKHGNNVIIRLTLRSIDGEQLDKRYKIVTKYKSYQLKVSDYFSNSKDGFCGSVEIEVFSKNKPLFTL